MSFYHIFLTKNIFLSLHDAFNARKNTYIHILLIPILEVVIKLTQVTKKCIKESHSNTQSIVHICCNKLHITFLKDSYSFPARLISNSIVNSHLFVHGRKQDSFTLENNYHFCCVCIYESFMICVLYRASKHEY